MIKPADLYFNKQQYFVVYFASILCLYDTDDAPSYFTINKAEVN